MSRRRPGSLALPLLALAAALIVSAPAFARPGEAAPVSRFTRLSERLCTGFGEPPSPESGDVLAERCPGIGTDRVWLLFAEGMYLRVGFGRVGNVSGMFDAERSDTWPIEWRGVMRGGRFRPFATIMRLRPPHQTTGGDLIVFHLTDNGGSCIVARVPPGPGQNLAARAQADRLLSRPMPCLEESTPFE